MMASDIELPDGAHVPATPGRYRLVPPPDLNEVTERRFFLEQLANWEVKHPRAGGHIGLDRSGYQLCRPSASRERKYRHQYIPAISYVDRETWSRLSDQDRDKSYYPCHPVVVIELMSATDKLENLQRKVSKFVDYGTHEGVVVDTRRNQVWIYNKSQQPYFEPLDTIIFDHWPGFELDCIAIRDARIRARHK